jgi:hypothetical protein
VRMCACAHVLCAVVWLCMCADLRVTALLCSGAGATLAIVTRFSLCACVTPTTPAQAGAGRAGLPVSGTPSGRGTLTTRLKSDRCVFCVTCVARAPVCV